MVGRAALIRVVSPTTPSVTGTLKLDAHENALAVDIDVANGLLGESHGYNLSWKRGTVRPARKETEGATPGHEAKRPRPRKTL